MRLRDLHRQNFVVLFFLIFTLWSLLVLLFSRNIDFATNYPRGDEKSDAKIHAFTGSQVRTQSVSEQNQKHFLCPRNKCCARGETFVSATMCPRLPGPLRLGHFWLVEKHC